MLNIFNRTYRIIGIILISILFLPIRPALANPDAAPESATEASNIVRLATTNWPPYVGEQLPGFGIFYQVVSEAFQQMGYTTHIEFLPWQDAQQLNKFNNDAFFPAYREDITDNLACSHPIHGGPIGLYYRKTLPLHYTVRDPADNQENALRGLKNYKFGVVQGYSNTAAFDNADFLQKIPVSSDLENLRQLNNETVDLIIIDVFVAEFLIDQNEPEFDQIEFMGPALENKQLFLCFDKSDPNYPEQLSAFNQGLKKVIDSGKVNQLIREYGF